MLSVRGNSFLFTLFLLILTPAVFAQNKNDAKEKEVLESGLQILKSYFSENNNWHLVQPGVDSSVNGLINYFEDRPIDDIIKQLNNAKLTQGNYVLRLPEHVEDSLSVLGYMSAAMVEQELVKVIDRYIDEVKVHEIMVPASVVVKAESEVVTIPEGKGIVLFNDSVYTMPNRLIIPDVIPDSMLNSPEQFERLVKTDSIRNAYIEAKRLFYNDSVKAAHVNGVLREYRQKRYDEGLAFRIKRYKDQINVSNYMTLKTYNDKVVAEVNDSIKSVIDVLTAYADYVDTTTISIENLSGQKEDVFLQNGNKRFAKVWLKNEQNDSIRVMVTNTGKRSMKMLIDDGVTFSRFKEKETKDFDFESLKGDYDKFSKMGDSYELETPWTLGGDGSFGFTQTYIGDYWKKGGKSSLASLIILKGTANYTNTNNKLKWENTGIIRNGWIRSGGSDEELKKNSDKFELTSRVGLSAFKKWYYSSELNINTQLFRGYNYPKEDNPEPLSGFMAPLKTYFKVGLDYKANKNMSLLLSPLTIKNVFVRDTSLIDQVTYGIDEDRKAFWEPGLNVDLTYKKTLTEQITYETKYNMFINYKDPLKKFDINWESTFKMQLNNYITMQFLVNFIYDDDVMFTIYDNDGEEIGEEAKLQVKEFFSIGFTYNLNKKVMRTHRVR